jgi:diaminopimelate decarboxylase
VLEFNLQPCVVASKADRRPELIADVVGRSCYADRIVPGALLPAVGPGDVVAFLDTGAYQESSASNFNALPRPGTVLVSGATAEVIKRAETVDDVFSRDCVPERLRAPEFELRSGSGVASRGIGARIAAREAAAEEREL